MSELGYMSRSCPGVISCHSGLWRQTGWESSLPENIHAGNTVTLRRVVLENHIFLAETRFRPSENAKSRNRVS